MDMTESNLNSTLNTPKVEKTKEEKVEVENGKILESARNTISNESSEKGDSQKFSEKGNSRKLMDPSQWAKLTKEEKRRYIRNNKKAPKGTSSGNKTRNDLRTEERASRIRQAEKARTEKIMDFKNSVNAQLSVIEGIRSQIDTEKLKTLVHFMSGTAFMDKPEDRTKAESWTPVIIGGILGLVVTIGLFKVLK